MPLISRGEVVSVVARSRNAVRRSPSPRFVTNVAAKSAEKAGPRLLDRGLDRARNTHRIGGDVYFVNYFTIFFYYKTLD